MDRRLRNFHPLSATRKRWKTLKTVARNFARKINASKRWIQRVIKEEGGEKKKKGKSLSTQFSNLPHPPYHESSSFTNGFSSVKNVRIQFFAYFACEIRRKRRNRDYSLEKRTFFEAGSNEWRKDYSKGIRIILLERQGSNPPSIHRAFLPLWRRGKKGKWHEKHR